MDFTRQWPVRAVALLTAAYSTGLVAAPKILARPTGSEVAGKVPADVAGLTRSLATRDVALSLALALSPAGYPMRLLTLARVVSDGSDVGWFHGFTPKGQRLKISGAAALWATVEAAVLVATDPELRARL